MIDERLRWKERERGRRDVAGRQKGSERRGEREEGARREVEVSNGSVVAVARFWSHVFLRFRVIRV